MAVTSNGRKIYRSMQGVQIELDKLILRNETTLAVGNAKVNARGDELGPGGKIVKKADPDVVFRSDSIVATPVKKVPMEDDYEEPERITPVVQTEKTVLKPIKQKPEQTEE